MQDPETESGDQHDGLLSCPGLEWEEQDGLRKPRDRGTQRGNKEGVGEGSEVSLLGLEPCFPSGGVAACGLLLLASSTLLRMNGAAASGFSSQVESASLCEVSTELTIADWCTTVDFSRCSLS